MSDQPTVQMVSGPEETALSSGLVLYLSGRRVPLAIAVTTVVGIAAPLIRFVRIPLPLSEVGATVANGALIAFVVTLLWGRATAIDLWPLEGRFRPQLRRWRLALVLRLVTSIALGGLLGAAVTDDAIVTVRFCFALAFFAGLAAATRALTLVPWWLPGLSLVIVMMSLGVDRRALVPRDWAWLISDAPSIQLTEVLVTVFSASVGFIVFVMRPGSSADPAV